MRKIRQTARLFIALSFLCFGFMQVAWAGFDEALDAYKREDYKTAFRGFSLLAEQGHAKAQYGLGIMYANGQGVTKDEQQAVVWFRKSAEQGDAGAQYNLASKYVYGLGVAKDEQQAVMWYRKAAEQGNAGAQFSLGVMYADGIGVPKDEQQAVVWYRKAAEQGGTAAQVNLGLMYSDGRGVAKDEQQAVIWYRKAADQGDATAQYNLGTKYENGQGVLKDEQQAVLWYRKAAEQGDESAQVNLGAMYHDGLGVTKDEQQAYFWWLLASAKGLESAKKNIETAERTLPPQQRKQAQVDARNWKPKTAQQVAAFRLPEVAEESAGDSVERDSPAPHTKVEKSSGTGFVVSPNQIVTNVHVADGCAVLKVNGRSATVRAMDTTNDLALLATSLSSGVATLRAGNLRQGDEVNAVGYPLYGLLASGAQITSGNVSALAGMRNDSRFIQISAPVQPGNSGGPLVDASGNVVGVIVSKLNAVAIAKLNGDIPQNINFAISPLVLKGFLEANHVKYKSAPSNKNLSTSDVMSIATRYTVLVECSK